MIFSVKVIFFLSIISFASPQEVDEKVEFYKKTTADKRPPRKPRPSPNAASHFAVKAEVKAAPVGIACSNYPEDEPCKCALDPKCEYDELTEKCVPTNAKFLDNPCQREGSYYAFSSSVICKAPAGNCKDQGTSVYAINLNGDTYISTKGDQFREEDGNIKVDLEKASVNLKASCAVSGASGEDAKIYQTFVEGKPEQREEGICVGYPIPLIQDGSYAIIFSTLSEANKCMDIKMAGASVAVDIDLMKLSGDENCKALDIIINFFVEDSQGQMFIKGHQTPVPIDGGFTAKFCYAGCDDVPDSVYRISAFNLIRYGNNSKKVENIATYVMMNGDGTHIFTHVDLGQQKDQQIKSQLESKLNQQKEKDEEKREQIKKEIEAEVNAKIEQSRKTKMELRKKCPALTDPSACKIAGCEFNLITKTCNSPESFCAETKLGKVNCYRANAFYTSGGVLCPAAPFENGDCDVGEVKFSINILGSTYQDVNGIDYSSGISDLTKLETEKHVEYLDLASAPSVCKKSQTGSMGGGDMVDEQLYSGIVRGKGSECLSYPITNLEDGSYELSIKTIEPFYEQAGKRAFNVKINEETVLKNFDIANYVGSCQGIDIFIQFQISGDILMITGFPQKPGSVKSQTITLSFCPGDDGSYSDLNFIASAIYIARLKVSVEDDNPFDSQNSNAVKQTVKIAGTLIQPDQIITEEVECPECGKFNKNPEKCLEAGFEYNVNFDTCVKRPPDCKAMFSNDPTTCRKDDVVYIQGGVPCHSRNTSGNCDEGINTHALNLAGNLVVDGKGYKFLAEGNFALDLDYSKMDYTVADDGCDKVGSFDEAKNPFGTFIRGKPGSASGACVSYPIAVCQSGDYILGIDVMESPDVKDRCFDIKIDEVTIMKGVNNFKLAGKSCSPVELAFPMRLESFGASDTYTIHVRGIDQPIPIKKKFYLKFCTCEWKSANHVYQVSNFDFTRYGVGGMTCDACHSEDGNENACVELGCKYDASTQLCQLASAKEMAAEHCRFHDDSPNSCKKDGCELNLVTKKCHPGIGMGEGTGICSESIFTDYSNCRRANAYYLQSGQFCLNKEESGSCNAAQPTWAININGKDFTSSRGILFSGEKPFMSNDPLDLRVAVNPAQYCTEEKDKEFTEFIATGIQGDASKKKTGGCINFPVPLCEDGFYEMSIFTVDGLYDKPNKRCFDIKLNSLTVAYSVDLVRLGAGRNNNEPKKCVKNEIIILFKVENGISQLTPLGCPEKIPLNGNLLLQICFGRCGYADPVFQISGFSVSKFGPTTKTCDKCALYNKNPTSCEKEACEYNVVTKKCTKIEDKCGQHSQDICRCVEAGCKFDANSNKCIGESETHAKKLKCRRPRSFYAFSSKTLCKFQYPSEDAKAECKTGSTVYGVNAGGRDYEDSDGLKYKRETAGARLDPTDLRKAANTKGLVELKGVTKADSKRLYGSFVAGSSSKQTSGGSLAYPVVLKQDGQYEIIIKFMEPVYKEERKRIFDVKINNIPVVVDIDLVKLAGGDGVPVDISILFFIENSGKILKIKGSSTTIPISSGFHLQFTYGSSKLMISDTSFVFSAFTVVRYGEDTVIPDVMKLIVYKGGDSALADPCEAHGEHMNDCKADGCEFDLINKKCLHQAKDCPDTMYAEYSKCQRGGAMYGTGGILCRSKINTGKCTGGETILALNLNGGDFLFEDRQISFRADKTEDFSDPGNLRTAVSSSETCKEVKDKLVKNLLMSGISGKADVKEGCLDFPISLKGDGEYELSVLTMDGKHKSANQKCFDVMLNSITIFASVDPYRISGKTCAKAELIILFKVEGSQLKAMGFSTPIEIADSKVTLSFCQGKCVSPGPSINAFQISAFYIFKFKSAVTATADCKDFARDANKCKSSGCEYDLVRGQCISKMGDCEDGIFTEYMKCRRKDAFYANAGILCKNSKAECNIPQGKADEISENSLRTIIATNINGEDYKYREINFQSELGYTDEAQSLQCRGVGDDGLFKTVASSSTRASATGCISYSIPIPEDGFYELSVWSIDSETEVNKKCWDIELDYTAVAYAIDPARLSGSCKPSEIIILFKVQDSVSQIVPLGFPDPILIAGKKVDLNFCMGSCAFAPDKNFHISAFSLIKFQPKVSKPVLEERTAMLSPGADPCTIHGKNPIACHAAGCEFSLVINQCVHKIKQCNDNFFAGYTHCTRGGAHYGDGGVLCKNDHERGDCDYRKGILMSLNLGGKNMYIYRMPGRKEIFMHLERSWDYDESEGKRLAINNAVICPNLLKSRYSYYYDFLATAVKVLPGSCLTYTIPLKGDGIYEISLMLVDGEHNGPNQRCFDVMLNQQTVLFALDIISIAGNCRDAEIIILFKVERAVTKLTPKGFTEPMSISGGKVDLKFCGGSCGYPDESAVVSGLYVMKIGERDPVPSGQEDPCTIHGSDKITCHKAFCEFDFVKNKCVHPIQQCPDDTFINNCKRDGIYYQNAGVLCHYQGPSSHDCNFDQDVTIALNLGGRELYTFHDGDGRSSIHFRLEKPGDFDESEGQRHMVESGLVCRTWATHYQTYYNNFLVNSVGSMRGSCLTYYLPLKGDGLYEASIWTAEGQYRGPNQRCFDIKIYDKVVIFALDVAMYQGTCNVMEIMIQFKVEGGQTRLTVKGFPDPITISGEKVDLKLCGGSCGAYDQTATASGIYLMKIG